MRMKKLFETGCFIRIWVGEKARSIVSGLKKHEYVSGVTVIELVLILVILIALLLIFKDKLIELINTIFDKITSESSGI